ncbi:hypothetical protein AMK68_03120 [candidate division KD3-62 bacterium DG_56]|uniref:Uncharacterized protein n=1 Tax=candidate division KD3-62 bacterium DG_56 TaxID=1704032 RepID=A0A0S7XN75_9BACT|nr:MAG: hypothetical protein AMK68_03120 [candidate division KD3-62 bacterium DG_56]
MRRGLALVVLLAAMPSTPGRAVDLVQGWQIVSFSILEPMPLDRFDVIDQTTGERRPFPEACAPGPDCWMERALWWYDPVAQGYQMVSLGGGEQEVLPDRGHWVWSYSEHPLKMVPTYDVADCFPLQLGSIRLMDALGNDYQGTYSVLYSVDQQANICGIACYGRQVAEWPLGAVGIYADPPEPYDWWIEWWATVDDGLCGVGTDQPDGSSLRFNPPILFHDRMYPGENRTQTVVVAQECEGFGLPVSYSMRFLGPEVVNTACGDVVCLKLEATYENPIGPSYRLLVWFAPGVGEVRRLYWSDDHLDSIEEVVDWSP